MDPHVLFQKFVSFTASVHQVTQEMTKDVRPEAVTPVQYQILEYIAVSQPVTPSQISDCQHMSLPNTSREIKKLCEKRLCEKYADPERPAQAVCSSDSGRRSHDGEGVPAD
ncbi:MarR family winged helix-turn-helix transcriptional regulator [Paenibacillus sp. TAB 01]|uniref:MarR family winged helix-turn-helix transcriptional regulator n=1 Tax=Paenibacillus sp. TAB 01 TaxID=3368988 RepID=UPI0037527F73